MLNKKILVVDDHSILRFGLKILIKNIITDCVIFESSTVKHTQELLLEHTFDFAVLDLQVDDGNILDILAQIRQSHPGTKILIYTLHSEDVIGPRVLKMGVSGFLSKSHEPEEVNLALKRLFAGEQYISKKLKLAIDKLNAKGGALVNPLTVLSDRELAVFNYLIQGETIKQISVRLKLMPNTVTTLKARIYEKLSVTNLIQLKDIADLYYINKLN